MPAASVWPRSRSPSSSGAEVFATAGSDEKREFLRSLGVKHVYSSRIDGVCRRDPGRHRTAQGVDVVLNSLPGEAITKSLSILRAYGRFLEIGKTDIYQNRMIGLLPFQDNLSYFAIDLDRMLRQRPDYIRALFAEVMSILRGRPLHAADVHAVRSRGHDRRLPLHVAAEEHRQGRRGDASQESRAESREPEAAGRSTLESCSLQTAPISSRAAWVRSGSASPSGWRSKGRARLRCLPRRAPSAEVEPQLAGIRSKATQVVALARRCDRRRFARSGTARRFRPMTRRCAA